MLLQTASFLKGESRVNESLLTGESVPVVKKVGDFVIGGSTNEYSKLEVKVTKTGKDAYLSQVKNLIMDAQSNPSRAENNAKKVAGWLFYLQQHFGSNTFIAGL